MALCESQWLLGGKQKWFLKQHILMPLFRCLFGLEVYHRNVYIGYILFSVIRT